MEPALVYLQKVKARYSKDPERYRRFLELLSPSEAPGALNDVSCLSLHHSTQHTFEHRSLSLVSIISSPSHHMSFNRVFG